eukprot:360326-Chlamydomonas_euryale.AAC.2
MRGDRRHSWISCGSRPSGATCRQLLPGGRAGVHRWTDGRDWRNAAVRELADRCPSSAVPAAVS